MSAVQPDIELDIEKQLKAIPGSAKHLQEECLEQGLKVTIGLPCEKKIKPFFKRFKADKPQSFILEGLGLELFELVNSRNTVDELLTEFQAKHMLSFFEARNLVVQYLGSLMEHGLIVLTWSAEDN